MKRMRVLALVSDVTTPPITGSRVRNQHLWPAVVSLGHEVAILGLRQNKADVPQGPEGVRSTFIDLDREPLPVRVVHAIMYSFHQWPTSRALAHATIKMCADFQPDVIHAEELRMAAYLPRHPGGAIRSVTFHNVESDLYRPVVTMARTIGARFRASWQNRNLLQFERDTATRVDAALAYSSSDLARYRQIIPGGRWELTSNGALVEGVQTAPDPDAGEVLLVGSLSYYPNIEGLHWFLDRVRALLLPSARVTITGSRANAALRARLAREPVRFIDTPPDLAPLYAASSVVAVPLLNGSGTRGRVLEALAFGRVVVTTTKGIEGLDLSHGEGVIVTDDARDFADKINALLEDADERGRLAAAGRAAVMRRYSWQRVAQNLEQVWRRARSQSSK